MTRMKKTRAPGKSGASKKVDTGNTQLSTAKGKKHKVGNKSGSRHGYATATGGSSNAKGQNKDKRIGSTKPVALVSPKAAEPPKAKAKPQQQKPELDQAAKAALLESLENDERLNTLLDMLDEGEEISSEDESYVEQTTAKIEKLMAELGIVDDDDELMDDIDWDDEEQPV
ncbi:hypothetical protein EDC28_107151 [Gallaecimonas pentaromativorans]|uniref:Der GTPase-activating protein YihI n=2 Tax=Gallaecimonas pentaromativorans TaxID=584787 RepID=A0A3N1P880_9GAMM|nr:hypothetical protein EDC28_107151 [Gallaecimonas pentaromativorans]